MNRNLKGRWRLTCCLFAGATESAAVHPEVKEADPCNDGADEGMDSTPYSPETNFSLNTPRCVGGGDLLEFEVAAAANFTSVSFEGRLQGYSPRAMESETARPLLEDSRHSPTLEWVKALNTEPVDIRNSNSPSFNEGTGYSSTQDGESFPQQNFRWENAYDIDESERLERSKARTGSSLTRVFPSSSPPWHCLETKCEALGCYIYDILTGSCVVNHFELREAMDELKTWSMQVPGNCCLAYKHISGLMVTLPWPDLEAGAPEEIQEFVDSVNRVEGKTIFTTRYRESPYICGTYIPCIPPPSPSSVSATLKKYSSLRCMHATK